MSRLPRVLHVDKSPEMIDIVHGWKLPVYIIKSIGCRSDVTDSSVRKFKQLCAKSSAAKEMTPNVCIKHVQLAAFIHLEDISSK